MGVFSSASIDFQSIGNTMADTALNWMNAQIQIVDPNIEDTSWDPFTNEYTGGSQTVLWSGPARVQHLGNDSSMRVGYAEVGVRAIRVQVPLDVDAGFIHKGLQVIVTDAGNDYELEQLQFIITSAINSSYAWLRTIECEVDVKSIANSTWANIAGTVIDSENNPVADATVRTFRHDNDQWLMEYETTTDVFGNYKIPADVDMDVVVSVSKYPTFSTVYYDNVVTIGDATLITPVNHQETSNIDFVLEVPN